MQQVLHCSSVESTHTGSASYYNGSVKVKYFNANYIGMVVSFNLHFLSSFFKYEYNTCTSATLLSSKILYSCLLVVFVYNN